MKTLIMVLSVMLTVTTFSLAQEANEESQRRGWNVPRAEREKYGFAREQVKVEVVNKDDQKRATWMQRGPRGPRGPMMNRMVPRGPRGPMMNRGMERGPRGPMVGPRQFRGEKAIQRGCPLCEKHKKAVSKKHFAKGKKQQRGKGVDKNFRGPRHR